MAPPAKRRRRNTVEASDDDEVEPPRTNTIANYLLSSPSSPVKKREPTASPSPLKNKSAFGSNRNGNTRKAGISSPSPKKGRGFSGSDEKGKSGDLKALFSKQAMRAPRPTPSADQNMQLDDIISDPISDDDISELKASSSSLVSQHARKRLRNGSQIGILEATSTSSRFLKQPSKPSTQTSGDDLRPWSERFGPRNLDELAVHKKKVADVRKWLEDVISGRMRQRLLILKGAAGTGKTTTVQLLANDLGCELLEWRNPTGNAGTGFVSTSAQFQEFLGRGGKFGSLELDDEAPTSTTNHSRRIMVIEEFPNTFSRSSSALTSFRSALLGFLAQSVPSMSSFMHQTPQEPVKPVVLVISETLLTTSSAASDSLTAHRLLGTDIIGHPGVGVIEFNAVAPTLLAKALELVVQKEARKSGRRRTPGPQVLKRLGEIGDIRNAVASLEFLCLKGDDDTEWGGKVTFTKQKKGAKDGIGLTRSEEETLQMVSRRESTLGIFHAVGKVVYNKREEARVKDGSEDLPGYLEHNARPKRSQVAIEALIDEIGTDTHTFISALHENYALSCYGGDSMDLSTPMDYMNDCLDYMSIADLLCAQDAYGGRFAGKDSGSHLMRQDEMMFQVAVRGMLFSLPYPVQRKPSTTMKGPDAYKMFYPMSLKIWRPREEISSLVDVWSSKLLKGEDSMPVQEVTTGANMFRRTQSSERQSPTKQKHVPTAEAEPVAPLFSIGSAARRELLLERLPYMAQISRGRRSGGRQRDLEKIVSFRGVSATDEDSEPEDDTQAESWATDKPYEGASPRKRREKIKPVTVTSMLAEKLVLSDDDIED